MIAVSDTGPIRYLVVIDDIAILARLYRQVLIPKTVYDELRHPNTPSEVRAWIADPPDWV